MHNMEIKTCVSAFLYSSLISGKPVVHSFWPDAGTERSTRMSVRRPAAPCTRSGWRSWTRLSTTRANIRWRCLTAAISTDATWTCQDKVGEDDAGRARSGINEQRMFLIFILADSLFRCPAGAPKIEVSAETAADAVFFARFSVKLTRTVSWQLLAKNHLSAAVALPRFLTPALIWPCVWFPQASSNKREE